jgi:hypothetical protein
MSIIKATNHKPTVLFGDGFQVAEGQAATDQLVNVRVLPD